MAERFAKDWANQDYKAMHDELSDSAQAQYSAADLQSAYGVAQQASTATSIDPGDADGPKSVNGNDVVDVSIGVGTRLFGNRALALAREPMRQRLCLAVEHVDAEMIARHEQGIAIRRTVERPQHQRRVE
jgi:hypothetical protein